MIALNNLYHLFRPEVGQQTYLMTSKESGFNFLKNWLHVSTLLDAPSDSVFLECACQLNEMQFFGDMKLMNWARISY